MHNRTAIIIGCGIAGPAMAIFLKRIGIRAIIYEAKASYQDDAGLFLGISPNGLNVIREFLPLERLQYDCTPGNIHFFNAKSKQIGAIDTSYQKTAYGVEAMQVKRGLLNKEIRQAALDNGIEIRMGKKLTGINERDEMVTAYFEDGTTATADFLIGCDGIHSVTRKSVFPGALPMVYTGLLSAGGFAKRIGGPTEAINMIFGERAFFAYTVSNRNEVWWFNNISRDKAPERNELNNMEEKAVKEMLLQLHKNDPPPVTDIIRSAENIEIYPIYDIPFLPEWHKGRVCLIGDAAHATAPHIGQGASLALEDTMVLAQCIRDCKELGTAFKLFEKLRQDRVKKIVASARKVGDSKTVPNKFQQFFRDLLLPVFVKMEAKKMDWVFSYKVDWHKIISGD